MLMFIEDCELHLNCSECFDMDVRVYNRYCSYKYDISCPQYQSHKMLEKKSFTVGRSLMCHSASSKILTVQPQRFFFPFMTCFFSSLCWTP